MFLKADIYMEGQITRLLENLPDICIAGIEKPQDHLKRRRRVFVFHIPYMGI
jgi:hypothetical protein